MKREEEDAYRQAIERLHGEADAADQDRREAMAVELAARRADARLTVQVPPTDLDGVHEAWMDIEIPRVFLYCRETGDYDLHQAAR